MARISVVHRSGRYCVRLAGRLEAADLKRLERACRYALEHKEVPLELNLARVTDIDTTARTYLDRLRARGASVLGDVRT